MSATVSIPWHAANQRYLMAQVAVVREFLSRCGKDHEGSDIADLRNVVEHAAEELQSPSALDSLCTAFGLSAFERDILLLCAGTELDSEFVRVISQATGSGGRTYPTFALALAAFPDAHWSALAPAAPLRLWRLIELGSGDSLVSSPLRIDERTLHYLAGIAYVDTRLQDYLERVQTPPDLPASHAALADQIATIWSKASEAGECPAIQLCGPDAAGKRDVTAAACRQLGATLHLMRATNLPAAVAELESLGRLWRREVVLGGGVLMVECEGPEHARSALQFVEKISGSTVVSSREPLVFERRPCVRFDVDKPSVTEQKQLWMEAMPALASQANGDLDSVVLHFNLGSRSIRSASAQVLATCAETQDEAASDRLWEACRIQSRQKLDELAIRIRGEAAWQDLVLPDAQMNTLREIASHVRQRSKVYQTWGFAAGSSRGLGLSCLFAGPSGSGKTLAAEVLARDLRLDLFRIDLSQVVSKFIGETEKNLRRVFDAAEEGGAVLLFDEADALFGKRSEVKDSHDRYANIEVSYLLQKMEAYSGLAILTTNLKTMLDPAFLRRIRFVVQFPFPDAEQRVRIWRRIFPAQTPVEGLDYVKLARLNVTGGNIRNIALNAAFLAAAAGDPIRMGHLLRSTRAECQKLEKPLSDAEVAGWV